MNSTSKGRLSINDFVPHTDYESQYVTGTFARGMQLEDTNKEKERTKGRTTKEKKKKRSKRNGVGTSVGMSQSHGGGGGKISSRRD